MTTLATDASVRISAKHLALEDIIAVARRRARVTLDPEVGAFLDSGHDALRRRIAAGEVIYGVNTGFGSNARFLIPPEDVARHQGNLIEYSACGVGPPLPVDVVRASMLLRANALSRGWSAVRAEVVERLLDLLNHGVTPVVPRFGSVGASGDLCPSAYIARVLCGRGEVDVEGVRMPAAAALAAAGVPTLTLAAKEGLALINGTTTMTAVAALVIDEGTYLFRVALATLAMVTEALQSSPDYYRREVQQVKHHRGQAAVAGLLLQTLAGSQMAVPLERIRGRIAGTVGRGDMVVTAEEMVQSPYSLRCAPQGLGPMLESLIEARGVVEREANSANDNPLVDPVTGDVHHTGNFYGAHIARTMDGFKLDLANLANWLHALMAMLVDERFSHGLPPSLTPTPGVSHGFKGMQITHTSVVTAIRHWCAPSLIHTLPTEQFNQDVVSLGTLSAMTALDIVVLLRDVVSMTLLAAVQAVDLRGTVEVPGRRGLGVGTAALHAAVRTVSERVDADRALDVDIQRVSALIRMRTLPVPPLPTTVASAA